MHAAPEIIQNVGQMPLADLHGIYRYLSRLQCWSCTEINSINRTSLRKRMKKKIEIDSEFEAMIPPLSAKELEALEENLVRYGCRHPLVVWKGILVDGHNRYKICKKLDIAFEITELQRIDSRESAIAWMIDNQFARRNISDFQRAELALKKKDVLAALAQQNKGMNQHSSLSTNLSTSSKMDTRRELAKAAHISEGTIAKVEKITKCAVPEVLEKVRSEEIKIDVAFQVATLPKDEQVALAAAGPDALKAAAKDVRESKQDKKVADDATPESKERTADSKPKIDSPSKEKAELARLRAENAELRKRVKDLTKAIKSPGSSTSSPMHGK
jgi:hypothetical protein